MQNIRKIATKCMWSLASALTGGVGLAIGVLLALPFDSLYNLF